MPPRNYRNSSRRSRSLGLLLGGLGVFALLTVGVIGTLWIAGVPLNPFASREPVDDPFMVRIPINATPIPAYARVDRSHLLNPSGGGLMVQKVPPQAAVGMSVVGVDQNGSHVESRVESIKNVDDEVVFVVTGGAEVRQGQTQSLGGAIMNVNSIIGRVVKADKRAGMGFQETTFFPKGTPEGLAGATPPGMRAITLDATRLTGVHSLGAGDQIDLLASIPVLGEDGESSATASEVELLAQNAKVLRPVYVRNEVTSSASLMSGKTMQNVPKYEVAIAVAANDVIPLQNALNKELPITCVAHSMQPTQDDESELVASSSEEVRVPVTVRPILAYQVVSRDAFVSPATRSIKMAAISRQEADRMDVITSVNEALGAITRQDIPAGRYLRQSDLLKGPPQERSEAETSLEAVFEGSNVSSDGKQFVAMLQQSEEKSEAPAATAVGDRPAVTTFIPPGMRGLAIPWNDLYGAEHLQIGDTIDLMVSYDLERPGKEKITEKSGADTTVLERDVIRSRKTTRTYEESYAFRGEPWFVATKATVIGPLGFPAPAPALRTLQDIDPNRQASGRVRTSLGGPPVLIAVSDLDSENVAAALATKEALFSYSLYGADIQQRGMKRIAILPGEVVRLERLDESVFESNRRGLMHRYVSIEDPRFVDAIEADDVSHYYGRVFSRTKKRWEPLRHSDFLPEGTKPGLAATIGLCRTITVVDTRYVEALAAFEEGDHVTIILRNLYQIMDHVHYAGPYRHRPSSEVVVEDATIVRRELETVVIELTDSDASMFQAALAFVKGLNVANASGNKKDDKSGSDQGSGVSDPRERRSKSGNIQDGIPSLVAVGRPRLSPLSSLEVSSIETASGVVTKIPPVDPESALHFMDVIVGSKRSVWAFDRE